jgi:hypothetical protein
MHSKVRNGTLDEPPTAVLLTHLWFHEELLCHHFDGVVLSHDDEVCCFVNKYVSKQWTEPVHCPRRHMFKHTCYPRPCALKVA